MNKVEPRLQNKQTKPTPNMNFPQRTTDNAEGKKNPQYTQLRSQTIYNNK